MLRPFRVPMEASISRSKRPSYLNSGARKIRTPSMPQNSPRESTGSCLTMVGQMKRLTTTSAWLFVDLPTSGSNRWLPSKNKGRP